MKKKSVFILTALVLGAAMLMTAGCEEKTTAQTADVPLCTDCGQIKGADACCQPDQEKCGCGMDKGSPGCCNIPEGAESAALCGSCGQIKGAEACCQPDQAKCEACGLDQGSPGCCKIPPKQDS